MAAGAEERRIAVENGNFHEGVPSITVIADGGWSKRSHKHSYSALGGVGIIIGKETGKVLYMGIRNKYCYICYRAKNQNIVAKPHQCYQNWNQSSQAMEADIIVNGFIEAEKTHGLRYMYLVGDGDSSVFAKIQEDVPVWGKWVQKIECANHACKCLRSNLEKLVEDNPSYKGRNKLTKATRVRLVSAVRCAIRVRSKETDRSKAVKTLSHDIRNSIHHIFGNHLSCSDFCKARSPASTLHTDDSSHLSTDGDVPVADVCADQVAMWSEGTSIQAQEHSRLGTTLEMLDKDIQQDVCILLDRLASKSNRLMGNTTTNLAECWMNIRCKFDGGKVHNVCSRGSWHTRCYGGSLRMNLGPEWSPNVWQQATTTNPGYYFAKLYADRNQQLKSSWKSKVRPGAQSSRWKRKMTSFKQSTSKKAKSSYGPDALDVVPDIPDSNIQTSMTIYLEKHIDLSATRIDAIERLTKLQSQSPVWKKERRKRITASVFGCVVRRKTSNPVAPLVRRMLYSNFSGNQHTRRGLQQERVTVREYELKKAELGVNVTVTPAGLMVSKENKFLGGSPDGIVKEISGETGLIEIKNLLHSKNKNLTEAATSEKQFCLKLCGNCMRLKENHDYYYHCQGLLGITKLPWIDFIVRTTNPYQLHIERIFADKLLWENVMIPKLHAFYYKAILPELACPREGKVPGIREPGVWFQPQQPLKEQFQTQSSCKPPPTSVQPVRVSASKSTRTSAAHDQSVIPSAKTAASRSAKTAAKTAAKTSASTLSRTSPRTSAKTAASKSASTLSRTSATRSATPPARTSAPPSATTSAPPSAKTAPSKPAKRAASKSASTLSRTSATVSATPPARTSGRTSAPPSASTSAPPPATPSARTSATPSAGTSATPSTGIFSRRHPRRTITKFVGRRISQEWAIEGTGETKWYSGTVLSVLQGSDGDVDAVYEILYDGEDDPHEVDNLLQHLQQSAVRFIDL